MKKWGLLFIAVIIATIFSVSCSALFGTEPPPEETVYIVSDTNLIRMLSGTTQETSVTLTGNTQARDENTIVWSSGDPQMIGTAPSTGSAVVLSTNTSC
jgi:hypothetical protein